MNKNNTEVSIKCEICKKPSPYTEQSDNGWTYVNGRYYAGPVWRCASCIDDVRNINVHNLM